MEEEDRSLAAPRDRDGQGIEPQDARPASAEGPGAASGGGSVPHASGVAARLRDLQRRLDALVEHVERAPGTTASIGGDAEPGARIVIVRTPPARPEVPERGEGVGGGNGDQPPGEPPRRAGQDRRQGPRERRGRRDRRRPRRLRRRDPRPTTERLERRGRRPDRRSGRGDRRLGHDRRARRRPRARGERRVAKVVLAIALQAVLWAAAIAALLIAHHF